MINRKLENLDAILKDMKSFIIAFSGGVDSTFLLHRASLHKKLKVSAITIKTPYIPKREVEEAVEFCTAFGITHTVLELNCPEEIIYNPLERCYLCKRLLFSQIKSFAEINKFVYVADGSNADDNGDFRPGLKALEELGIRSPLMESGLIKHEIRELSRRAELPTWDKPAYACLLTRIPYDTVVTENDLRMVEEAEQFFFEKGFPGTRVRIHGKVARIECLPGYINKMVQEPEKDNIISNLKKIGFRYVSLDLEGYRTGSFNPEKKEK